MCVEHTAEGGGLVLMELDFWCVFWYLCFIYVVACFCWCLCCWQPKRRKTRGGEEEGGSEQELKEGGSNKEEDRQRGEKGEEEQGGRRTALEEEEYKPSRRLTEKKQETKESCEGKMKEDMMAKFTKLCLLEEGRRKEKIEWKGGDTTPPTGKARTRQDERRRTVSCGVVCEAPKRRIFGPSPNA
eukprot:GHVS01041873.1.p1 GENE.GHVS01041873.1~~GHVS01041873.1.p1  ORF type:complete len:185 (+),score=67.30 GHVS01041873.1:83-637(+)